MGNKKKVLIDPGHGGSQPGATVGEVQEKLVNLMVAREVLQALDRDGYQVSVTRNGDETVSLTQRLQDAMEEGPDAFVSIHCNALDDSGVNGIEVYYRDAADEALAREVSDALGSSGLWRRNRGVLQDEEHLHKRLTVLNSLMVPSCLVEIGYLTNEGDRGVILRNVSEIGELIAAGIEHYLGD